MNNHTNNSSVPSNGNCFISQTQRSITIPVLIAFAIPSLICFIIIFRYFIRLRKSMLYQRLNHHVIVLILISDFLLIATELPFSLYYLGLGYSQTSKICTFWIYWDYTLEVTSLFLTSYASIERYLLVFHKNTFLRQKVLFHYIPIAIFGLYIPILYFYLVVLSPCVSDHQYDLTAFACGGPCYFSYFSVNTYDTIVDTMLPCLIVLFFNLLIIIRVVMLRRKARSTLSMSDTLKKNRRMILQLIGISLMCLIAWMPWVVIIIAQNFFDPSFGNWFITYILHYLPYLTSSLSPFIALVGLPQIREKLAKHITQMTASKTIVASPHAKGITAIVNQRTQEVVNSSEFKDI